jgi:uncharacterized protein (DUF2235 family)
VLTYISNRWGNAARPDPWTKLRQNAVAVLGLATGYGLDDNVLAAYEFLVSQHEDGDEIYLFGFSRGAYTVRVLAGLVHKIGLLSPHQRNLAGAALTAYKQVGSEVDPVFVATTEGSDRGEDTGQPVLSTKDDRASQFARIVSSRWPTIKFVGVWDTVASVIVPRPDRFYAFSLQTLANTRSNPSVRIFRQAIAMDERRRMFRLDTWDEPQTFMHNRFSATNNAEPQDAQQVWFSGVHADIGGGYPEQESGLLKFPLIWMIEEAVKHGLAVDPRTVNKLAWGVQRRGSPFSYVRPDILRDPHDSMSIVWWLLEQFPKGDKYKEWTARKSFLGYYIPDAEPRFIPREAFIHQSVVDRMAAAASYRPENFPERPKVVPMSAGPV